MESANEYSHLHMEGNVPTSGQKSRAVLPDSVENRQWILAEHSPNSGKVDIERVFKVETSIISTAFGSTDTEIFVKTRYLSNAPGLRVLTEHAPEDGQLIPVRPNALM
jgi:hypothetical protein